MYSLFGWLVADGWCWFVLREKYCWLVAGGWFVLREKYCWLVADKPSEQARSCGKLAISILLSKNGFNILSLMRFFSLCYPGFIILYILFLELVS
jgi:hypothetical protein